MPVISAVAAKLVFVPGLEVSTLTTTEFDVLSSKDTEDVLGVNGKLVEEEEIEGKCLCVLKHAKNEFDPILLDAGEQVYWNIVAKLFHMEANTWSDQDICGSDVAAFVRVLLQARRNFIKHHRVSTTPEHVICAYLDTLLLLIEQNPGVHDMGDVADNHGFADQVHPDNQ